MEQKRKGARSLKDLSPEIRSLLNKGEIESANLTEWLAVDKVVLIKHVLQQKNREQYFDYIHSAIQKLNKQTTNTLNETIGLSLLHVCTKYNDLGFLEHVATHTSDTVRCWATYTIGQNSQLSLSQKLEQIQTFAADTHFGVREISWMSVRQPIIENLEESLQILSKWTLLADENVRRFTTEATRPRGVWCQHIEVLKQTPELALDILSPLKADPSKYVCDSVGNWLNDASKSQPQFVLDICKQWELESPTKSTLYITKKALRTINK